jgi:hypothetical protein
LKSSLLPARSKIQRPSRACGERGPAGEVSGRRNSGATAWRIMSQTTLPSSPSKAFIGWKTWPASLRIQCRSATLPPRGRMPMCVPNPGSQA